MTIARPNPHPGAHAANAPTTTAERAEPIVRVRDLRKRYTNGVEAVRGVSFDVSRGEVVGLLGPNGAGKTTTIEILAGFRTRDAGDVSVLGLDPARRGDARELRRRMSIVLQHSGHLRYLTVREILRQHTAYHPDPRSVDELLELVGLTDAATQQVRELSGGQQRRLDVAVALVGRPELIFLDEPTTGFDPAARRHMWQVVRDLVDEGTSVVLTTHYMEEASELADRVLVFRRGEVVGEGTPESLARTLDLGTTIRATLPSSLDPSELPEHIRAGVHPDGMLQLEGRDDATSVLAQLCTWAAQRGVELSDLEVRSADLETSYLKLTQEPEEGE